MEAQVLVKELPCVVESSSLASSLCGQTRQSAKLLQTQAALLLLLLQRVPQSTTHLLTDINHEAVEDMHLKLCLLRQDYVESNQKTLFGNDRGWADIEADEATFDRRDISNDTHRQHMINDQKATALLGYIVKCFLE